jgi:ketosteroid isomerase-like protein
VSEEQRAIIRRAYYAFTRQDAAVFSDVFRGIMHPDFELDFSESLGPDQGIYKGEDGVRKLFEAYWAAFESLSIEAEEFIDAGAEVVAVVRVRGRGRESGVDVDARGPHIWSFRDGKVVGFMLYQDMEEALEAVGLSE